MQRVGLARYSFYDVSPGFAPTADQTLIVGLEEWQGLVLTSNGLSGPSPTDITLVDNRRKKFGKVLTSVYLSRIPASQTQLGLNDPAQRLCWIAHRMVSCSFYHHRGN